MGRGDKRSKRGKITIGSFGKKRPAKVGTSAAAPAAAAADEAKAPAKKAAKPKKTEE